MSFTTGLNVGLCLIGWAWIMVNAGHWLIGLVFRQWDHRRKKEKQQKAVDALYEAFELDKMEEGNTLRCVTQNGLTVLMFRNEQK